MMESFQRASARTKMNIVFFVLFFGCLLFFGGASRADVASQAVARMASILMIGAGIVQMDRGEWASIRTPVWFLVACAAAIAVQLVPLPPGLWLSLPGHGQFARPMAEAGVASAWRPISLTPDLTLDSLLSLLPPIAAAVGMGLIGRPYYRYVLILVLLGIGASALLALLQIAGGGPYFYRITNIGTGVGVFANRNHQAAMVAMVPVLISAWITIPSEDWTYRRLKFWIGLCGIAAVLPLLLITGSRAGLVLAAIGGAAAVALRFRVSRRIGGGRLPLSRFGLFAAIPILLGVAAVGATFYLSRDVAFHRLFDTPASVEEKRSEFLPVYERMIGDFFPFGSGYGSFDPVFRGYEPHAGLTTEYMNEAHNDLAQSLIEGGLFSLVLLACLALWYVVRAARLWGRKAETIGDILGRAGSAVVLIVLGASLVDYPLRTPLIGVLAVLAGCWMLPGAADERAEASGRQGLGSPGGLG